MLAGLNLLSTSSSNSGSNFGPLTNSLKLVQISRERERRCEGPATGAAAASDMAVVEE